MSDRTANADPETGEVIEGTSVELVPLPVAREALLSGRPIEVEDPGLLHREIALQLLESTSPEQLFAPQGTTPPLELMGRNMVLEGVKFMPSTVEEEGTCPIYCVMRLTGEDGRRYSVSCGGMGLVVQCIHAVEQGWLPWAVRLVEVGKQRPGRNRPIYLETAD